MIPAGEILTVKIKARYGPISKELYICKPWFSLKIFDEFSEQNYFIPTIANLVVLSVIKYLRVTFPMI